MPHCIQEPELSDFIRGKLAESRAEEVSSHIDDCEACQDTVIAMSGEDTFIGQLGNDPSDEPAAPQEPAFRHGLQRLLNGLQHANELCDRMANPQQIGPYLIESKLGDGGMGTVFRAQHSKLKRTVALKILPSHRWSNAQAIARFEREMEAIGQLDHPHVVRASDAGEDQGMHYLVMEYVDGLDLARLAKRLGPMPVADACELARQTAIGLQHAHTCGLIHRDVKPSNLMLAWERSSGLSDDTTPSLKILDLGLALLGDEHLCEERDLTTVGALMGTLDYMSPEQGVDSHAVDHRADIYGLGATLFKLLTGRAPYGDPQYSTLMKKMTALATKAAPSVGQVRPDLPTDVVKIVDKMLARDPDERFASARDVAEALTEPARHANLGKLLRNGLATEDPEASETENKLVRLNNAIEPRSPKPAERLGQSGTWKKWIVAAALGGSLIAGGIVFRIATDYGEIIVESTHGDLEVVVKQRKKSVEHIRLKSGKGRVRVRSGKYEIEVMGEDAELVIQPNAIQVRRNGISRVPLQPRESAAMPADPPIGPVYEIDQPRYDGKTLEKWLNDAEFERNPKRLADAFRATKMLMSHPANAHLVDDVVQTSFQLMREFGDRPGSNVLLELAWHILIDLPNDRLVDRAIKEIASGNAKSRNFLLQFLMPHNTGDVVLTTFLLDRTALFRRSMISRADELGSAIAEAGPSASDWGTEFLYLLTLYEKENPQIWANSRELFVGSMDSDDTWVASMAIWLLVEIDAKTPGLAKHAKDILTRFESEIEAFSPSHLFLALQALEKIGPSAHALQEVANLLDSDVVANESAYLTAFDSRPVPNRRLPKLVDYGGGSSGRLSDGSRNFLPLILRILAAYGEDAKIVLPQLISCFHPSSDISATRRLALEIDPTLNGGVASIKELPEGSRRLAIGSYNLSGELQPTRDADPVMILLEFDGKDSLHMSLNIAALFRPIQEMLGTPLKISRKQRHFLITALAGNKRLTIVWPLDQVRGAVFHAECMKHIRQRIQTDWEAVEENGHLNISLHAIAEADDARPRRQPLRGGMGGGMF